MQRRVSSLQVLVQDFGRMRLTATDNFVPRTILDQNDKRAASLREQMIVVMLMQRSMTVRVVQKGLVMALLLLLLMMRVMVMVVVANTAPQAALMKRLVNRITPWVGEGMTHGQSWVYIAISTRRLERFTVGAKSWEQDTSVRVRSSTNVGFLSSFPGLERRG